MSFTQLLERTRDAGIDAVEILNEALKNAEEKKRLCELTNTVAGEIARFIGPNDGNWDICIYSSKKYGDANDSLEFNMNEYRVDEFATKLTELFPSNNVVKKNSCVRLVMDDVHENLYRNICDVYNFLYPRNTVPDIYFNPAFGYYVP